MPVQPDSGTEIVKAIRELSQAVASLRSNMTLSVLTSVGTTIIGFAGAIGVHTAIERLKERRGRKREFEKLARTLLTCRDAFDLPQPMKDLRVFCVQEPKVLRHPKRKLFFDEYLQGRSHSLQEVQDAVQRMLS